MEVRIREDKAASEKVQLEQKLKLQRVELARRTHAVQSAEDAARGEIQTLVTATSTAQAVILESSQATRGTDVESYEGEHVNLVKEVRNALNFLFRAVMFGLSRSERRRVICTALVGGLYIWQQLMYGPAAAAHRAYTWAGT